MFALADALAVSAMIELGHDPLPMVLFGAVAMLVYLYVLYKRYHVEVVTSSDLMLFDDEEDLRILSGIYGLRTAGDKDVLRNRLVDFARTNEKNAFVWVAPRVVSSVASTLHMSPPPRSRTTSEGPEEIIKLMISDDLPSPSAGLLGGRSRSSTRRSSIEKCPICGARPPRASQLCRECGADLEFYEVLSESKVGRLLISEKAEAGRRKVGYGAAPSGEAE